MIILQGQAKATEEHPTFDVASIHSIIAIVNTSSAEEAGKKITKELTTSGFEEIRFYKFAEVSLWRAILLNGQGRNLRAALLAPVINVYANDDGKWIEADA
jgi:hypothetical protein